MNEELTPFELVESLDFEKIPNQVKYIFSKEKDCIDFANFIKKLSKFAGLSQDTRHQLLIQLAYFKSQLSLFCKKVKSTLDKRNRTLRRDALSRLKTVGITKPDKEQLTLACNEDNMIDNFEELYFVATSWLEFLTDSAFSCGATNRNLGDFNN